MNGYEKLQVYQRGYAVAKSVYRMTESYPKEERYGITDQMRRAAVSVSFNIAEGYAKKDSQPEFKRFLEMAKGSAYEMSVLIDLSRDLGYINDEKHDKALKEYEEISKMLSVLIKRIRSNI